jgi:methionyl-tRNA formyltransferase
MSNFHLKVAFFGNNLEVLKCLSSISNVTAVYIRPDDGSNENVNSIKNMCMSSGIPIFQPTKKDLYSHSNYLQKANIDLIIVCGYKFIIPKEIFSIPKIAAINIHPSLLPKYRGQHVINWAIVCGESQTGISLHFMEETLDTGAIIIQKAVPIYFEDTAKDLHDRLYTEACHLLQETITDISLGKTLQSKLQDSSLATFFKPRKPEDGHIDWSKSTVGIYNLIRALSKPWPGAFTYFMGYKIIIWKAHIGYSQCEATCGKVINVGPDYITVSTIDGHIIITDYEIVSDTNNKSTDVIINNGDIFT